MTNLRSPRFRAHIALILVFAVTCLPFQAAGAQGSYPDGLVPAGETVQGSLFLFSPQVKIEGDVDGDVFIISQDVVVTGEIKGSLFVLSTAATIDGVLEVDLFTANSRLTIGPAASVGRSAYVAAGMVSMLPGSEVGHDLYMIALSGQLSGSVERYQRAHLGFLELLVLLFGDDGLLRPILPPSFRLPIGAADFLAASPEQRASHWSSAASALGMPALIIRQAFEPPAQITPFDGAALSNWLLARLRDFIPLLLIGLLLLWLFPRFLQGSSERLRARPLGSFGIGVVVFFVGYGAALLALALVVALGVFFAAIDFWNLALLTWGAGLGGLSVALAFFGLAIVYLSKIIVAFLFGAILLGWTPAATWGRRFWMLLLGEVIVVLLLAIPILGWVLSVLGTMFGLGAIYFHFRQRGQPVETPKQDLPEPLTAEDSLPEPQSEIIAPIDTVTGEPEAAFEIIEDVDASAQAIPEPYIEDTEAFAEAEPLADATHDIEIETAETVDEAEPLADAAHDIEIEATEIVAEVEPLAEAVPDINIEAPETTAEVEATAEVVPEAIEAFSEPALEEVSQEPIEVIPADGGAPVRKSRWGRKKS
jgi:cytoskeletal protein CcmA (bactofilin family)